MAVIRMYVWIISISSQDALIQIICSLQATTLIAMKWFVQAKFENDLSIELSELELLVNIINCFDILTFLLCEGKSIK